METRGELEETQKLEIPNSLLGVYNEKIRGMKFNVERSMQNSMDTVILQCRDSGGLVRKVPFSCNNCTIKVSRYCDCKSVGRVLA